jgi:dimethylargininase
MRFALTREVSTSLADCEVTFVVRDAIDVDRAIRQHSRYTQLLRSHGYTVLRLPARHDLPDAVFVEDPVIVLDEIAVALRAGAPSRRAEVESIEPVLESFRDVRRITEPGTVDGGDVLCIGRTLYVGRSTRSNTEGIRQLGVTVAAFGYRVVPVSMHDCLHLKSGCTWLGREILLDPARIEETAFADLPIVHVPAGEPDAADVLLLDDAIVMADTFPRTAERVRSLGHVVEVIDVSEFQKAEAGVTCLSVLFEAPSLPALLAGLVVGDD